MKVFEFRLQRVLDYREALEQWAKDAYLESRAARLLAEQEFANIDEKRRKLGESKPESLEDRKAIERLFQKFDDDESQLSTIVGILEAEEESKRAEWLEKRRELEALQKLRDEALDVWKYESAREEQKELDDFATMRRSA